MLGVGLHVTQSISRETAEWGIFHPVSQATTGPEKVYNVDQTSRVYMDTSDPIRSGRTAQSEYKMIIYTPQSEYNPLIGIEFLAEHKSWCSLL